MLKITFDFLDHALQIYESEKIRKNLFEHIKKDFQSLKEDDFFILEWLFIKKVIFLYRNFITKIRE